MKQSFWKGARRHLLAALTKEDATDPKRSEYVKRSFEFHDKKYAEEVKAS